MIGRPLPRLLGVAGKLGRENSMRSPRRTAQTAAALMVGLALVSAMAVFGASLSKSATASADQAISADMIVTPTGSGELSNSVAGTASAVPGVTADHRLLQRAVRVPELADQAHRGIHRQPGRHGHPADDVWLAGCPGRRASCSSTPPRPRRSTWRWGTRSGQVRHDRPGGAALGGIYQANALIGSYLVSAAFFLAHFPPQPPAGLLLRTAAAPRDSAVTKALAAYPNLQVQTRAQFEQQQASRSTSCSGWCTRCSAWR